MTVVDSAELPLLGSCITDELAVVVEATFIHLVCRVGTLCSLFGEAILLIICFSILWGAYARRAYAAEQLQNTHASQVQVD